MYSIQTIVRVLLCVSCVPASCVHIWFVSCPRLMSLWVNSCPAVFVSLSVINLCILVHACSVWFRLVYSLLTFTFMHLADAFIQSDLHCIQVTVLHLSALAFPGNRTHDLGVASAMLYHLSYRKANYNICILPGYPVCLVLPWCH